LALTDEERQALSVRLEAKLQPERIRSTLAFAGLYQLTHELIKDAVLPKVREYYWRGCNEAGHVYDEKRYGKRS
jgi:hypothetical protein